MKQEAGKPAFKWTRKLLDWENASAAARNWWGELEELNQSRADLVIKLAGELLAREATIDQFFLACCYSGREGVQENLKYLDLIKQDSAPAAADASSPAQEPARKLTSQKLIERLTGHNFSEKLSVTNQGAAGGKAVGGKASCTSVRQKLSSAQGPADASRAGDSQQEAEKQKKPLLH